MLDKNQNYVMEDYQNKSLFYSFLPGISGEKGIPLWCHYLNRGQCVASFGVRDKDHSIMEFYPAHQAAERTPLLGFRTFLKIDGVCREAFSDYAQPKNMIIGMNSLKIQDTLSEMGLKVEAEYESLPEEPAAGLMRKLTITNEGENTITLEAADGMAEVIPYGVDGSAMKDIGQTTKAWMQVLNHESGIPCFKVRASMEDSAQVTQVKGVHYGFARGDKGGILPVIVDKELIFGTDSACVSPRAFAAASEAELLSRTQNTCNDTPCCFFLKKQILAPGETMVMEELYGMAESQESLETLVKKTEAPEWFANKRERAIRLTEELTERIASKTGDPVFDAYCRQTFLDNLLRGGYPEQIGNKVMYLYSRKHGDMERDYNYFAMLPEYFTQGNGNFRDVNQNRRCDNQFSPFVGDQNIKMFYNALQINGYNPLGIEKVTYTLKPEGKQYLEQIPEAYRGETEEITAREYTPGELYRSLELAFASSGSTQDGSEAESLFLNLINASTTCDTTKFIEGYWCDHWTYNLDLIQSYLSVYPEKEQELFQKDRTYTFRQADAKLLPRRKRYEETENGLRQYHFQEKTTDTSIINNRYLKDEEGNIVHASLLEKMFALCTVKTAALDPYGMGIEMEGGKPGWYDALNGLPGLIGSSMAETYELERMLEYLISHAEAYEGELSVLTELAGLSLALVKAGQENQEELAGTDQAMNFWNQINDAKEAFWEETAYTVKGTAETWTISQLVDTLSAYRQIVQAGITKAGKLGPDVPATYFYYEALSYEKTEDGILPVKFAVKNTPDFLEGSVHFLKLDQNMEKKSEIYHKVKNSRLYDKPLKMYKVNASLAEATFELGRACAFTTGWLENESVWLHMEYKYLLELLKSGLYQEFAQDFHLAAVPFLDEKVYGRSPLENSSFIASSANPNPNIHGKGFVARLSGSTAEFLQMWQIMMFGQQPFKTEDGKLELSFAPVIPSYLIGEDKTVEARFLGKTPVIYCLADDSDFLPGNYKTGMYTIFWKEGASVSTDHISCEDAEKIRSGMAEKISVELHR